MVSKVITEFNEQALLQDDDGTYWLGYFDPNLTHQNGEPDFVWECDIAKGATEQEALQDFGFWVEGK